MEAWFRQDASLKAEDLIQRMPYTLNDNIYPGRKAMNRLVRRRELFRNVGRCLSWAKASHQKIWDKNLLEEVETNRDAANPNSTRHLQDLTTEETSAFKDAIYMTGEHLKKARGRELDGEEKESKRQRIEDRKTGRPDLALKLAAITSNTGVANIKKTQARKKTGGPSNTTAGSKSTTRKRQKRVAASVDGDHIASVPHLSAPDATQVEVISDLNDEEGRVAVVPCYTEYQAPIPDQQIQGYAVGHWTGEAKQLDQQQIDPALYAANDQDDLDGTPGHCYPLPAPYFWMPQRGSETFSSDPERGLNDFGQLQSFEHYQASQYQDQEYPEELSSQANCLVDSYAGRDFGRGMFPLLDSVDEIVDQMPPSQLQGPAPSFMD